MAGEASSAMIAENIQQLLAQSQNPTANPYITPQSYSATLQEFFGTTNFTQAFAGFPTAPGENFSVPVPAGFGDVAEDFQRPEDEAHPDRDPTAYNQATLDPIQVTGANPTATGNPGMQYVVNPENGAMLYSDGTIVDPNSGVAIVRPGEIGSMLWLRTQVPKWDEGKVAKWRETLFDQGYEVQKEGGIANDLIDALFAYHQNRYLNGGEIVPLLTPEQMKQKAVETRREAFSRADARNAVRAMYQRQFGEDPSDASLEEWSNWFIAEGTKMARKGYSGETLTGRTSGKVLDKFASDPAVKQETEEREENDYAGAAFERFFQAFSQL